MTRALTSIVRGWTFTVAAGHLLACAGWWWLAPGGFPWLHARAFSGLWLPLALGTICVGGVVGVLSRRERWAVAAHAACTATWVAGTIAAVILFADGRARIAVAAAAPVGVLVVGSVLVRWLAPAWRSHLATALAIVGVVIGAAFPFTQRAPEPSTHPPGIAQPDARGVHRAPDEMQIRPGLRLRPNEGALLWDGSDHFVRIDPLLRFPSRSPDGGWTLFASPRARRRDTLGNQVLAPSDPASGRVVMRATGVATHVLSVSANEAGDAVALSTWSRLDQPEFAHIAENLVVTITGVGAPRLVFSTSPGTPVDVQPADYPFGRPARFATLYADGALRIHEATSGEKGPFRVLAEGALDTAAPLALTLHDGDVPVLRIQLADFASQASTELSPTAGWGVPQNAISFRVEEDSSGDPAAVVLRVTWADTAIGRGFDTVGHSRGAYLNRVVIERLR